MYKPETISRRQRLQVGARCNGGHRKARKEVRLSDSSQKSNHNQRQRRRSPFSPDKSMNTVLWTRHKDEQMTKYFSSSANSLEAGVAESFDEPRVLLLGLAHVLTCVVFRDVS